MQTAVQTCEDKIFYLHWLLTNTQPTTLNLPAVNTVISLKASWCCVSFIPSGQFLFLSSPGLQTKKNMRGKQINVSQIVMGWALLAA